MFLYDYKNIGMAAVVSFRAAERREYLQAGDRFLVLRFLERT